MTAGWREAQRSIRPNREVRRLLRCVQSDKGGDYQVCLNLPRGNLHGRRSLGINECCAHGKLRNKRKKKRPFTTFKKSKDVRNGEVTIKSHIAFNCIDLIQL